MPRKTESYPMQCYSLSTWDTMPAQNPRGEFVRLSDVQRLIRRIVDEASASTMGCHSIIPDETLKDVCEQVGLRYEE